jgi:hypothetical protein
MMMKQQDLIRNMIMGNKTTPTEKATHLEYDEDEGEDVGLLPISPTPVTPKKAKVTTATTATSVATSASKVSVIKVTEDISRKLKSSTLKNKTEGEMTKKRKIVEPEGTLVKKKKKKSIGLGGKNDIDDIFGGL